MRTQEANGHLVSSVASVPVVVPPAHHVLIVGCGGDLKPLDVLIGAKKQGVIPRCVVRRPDQEAAHLADWWVTAAGQKQRV